jgi:hypothetical protein
MATPTFVDAELTCVWCRQSFPFTAGEQRFFSLRALAPPKRCKACRTARRQREEDAWTNGEGVDRLTQRSRQEY